MTQLRVAIATVGCRANQADSSVLARHLDRRVVELCRDFASAKLAVINTCCVTAEAERDCRKLARRVLAASSDARVLLTGCAVSAVEGFGRGLGDRVSTLLGGDADPTEIAAWINSLAGSKNSRRTTHRAEPPQGDRSRALLKIQTGCTHCCTYCIVPKARGPERSMPKEQVLDETSRLVDMGYTEVVVTGVQLGGWGADLPGRPRLSELVSDMADRLDPGRLRLSSIEPWSVEEALIEAVAGHDRICPHLHLPLQSGDDAVLRAMGREYSAGDYLELVRRIRERAPGAAVGTDVLAGFPGEDEQAFANTLRLLKEIAPAYLHAFGFSPRPGTAAAGFDDRPSRHTAKQRVRSLRALGAEFSLDFRRSLLGRTCEIVVEQVDETRAVGLTDTFVPVVLDPRDLRPRELVLAKPIRILDDGRIYCSACQTAQP